MSKRKIFLISAILILAVTYIFQLAFSAAGKIKEIKIKEIPDSILIENKKEKIELSKLDGSWFTEDKLPVKTDAVNYIIDTVSNIKIIDTVSKSNSESELAKYGLTEPVTVSSFFNKKQIQKILLGKTSTTGNQTYIKIDGKKEIYLAAGNLNSIFGVTQNELLDMTLYSVKENEVFKVQLLEGADNRNIFTAEKSGEIANFNWKITKTDDADYDLSKFNPEKFQSWINSLLELKAQDWIEDWQDFSSLEKNNSSTTLIINAADKEIKINIFDNDEEESKAVCICSENNFPCRISDEDLAKFKVTLDDFID
ncbi:MAG: DUF4340 domain-containing protein [Treponema sp.]